MAPTSYSLVSVRAKVWGVLRNTCIIECAVRRGPLQGQTKLSVAGLKMSKSSSIAMGLEVCFSAPMILPRWLGQR